MRVEAQPEDTERKVLPVEGTLPLDQRLRGVATRTEKLAGNIFILPAVLVVLLVAIFPLIISLYLSLSRLKFVPGGFDITFVGLANYRKLLVGSEQTHFLGAFSRPSPTGWIVFLVVVFLLLYPIARNIRGGKYSVLGLVGNLFAVTVLSLLTLLLVITLTSPGRPGTLPVTLHYVLIGITFQYLLGLVLALLATQRVPGRRFFRVIFLLPMMITPVGIAYMFRMLMDTNQGPLKPIWQAFGLGMFSWVNDPWGARAAVIIGDVWQWTPFMFIVLLAALEGQSMELNEAARVDGANRLQTFWYITLPQILPVSSTVILIRMIEAFKIIDLPNILTNGGPGTATESLTLHAFIAWRSLDLGGSAAIAYMLLFLVTFIGLSYVSLIRQRVTEV
jgi:multiple sugar transport system permease protein